MEIEKPGLELTPELIKQRSVYKYNYQVLSALRGPDLDFYVLRVTKAVITKRLRNIVLTREECLGDYTNRPLSQYDYDYLLDACGDFQPAKPTSMERIALAHYLNHIVDALVRCGSDPIWSGRAPELILLVNKLIRSYNA